MSEYHRDIIDAGEQIEEDRVKLADAVVKQDERMDSLERKSRISRETYQAIAAAARKIQINSDQLRGDVDDLLVRVAALEEYTEDE